MSQYMTSVSMQNTFGDVTPSAHALCSARCMLVECSSTMSMGAAGSTDATLSDGPAAKFVMPQVASKTVFKATALYCLHFSHVSG